MNDSDNRMNDTGDRPDLPPEEKELLNRLNMRYARHENDKVMMWLKRASGRFLLNKLKSRTSR